MNLFNWMAPRSNAQARDASDDFWFARISRPPAAGQPVTVDRALQLPVVWDCVNVLSDTAAALPLHFFLRQGERRTNLDDMPLAMFLRDQFELRKQQVLDLALTGNWFGLKLDINRGVPGSIEWIPTEEVTVQRAPNGIVRYKVHDSGGQTRVYVEGEVWHIKRPPLLQAGLVGMSPIEAGKEAISAALAVQDYAARFFANDCTPPFVVEMPGSFKNDADRESYLQALKRWWGGARRHSPGVLEFDAKLNRVGVNNEEAQFLETRKELGFELTRLWRMPPHKVGLLDKATFSNIEQQSLEFVMDTMLPWLVMIEKSIRRDVLTGVKDVHADHNVAGLLRGDLKARYEAYGQARNWGWLSVNDIRALENMDPIAGGDVYLQPMNMVPAGTPPQVKAQAQVLGPDGRAVSSLHAGGWSRSFAAPASFENVIKIEDYRDAA